MSIFKKVMAAHEYEVRGEKKTSWKEVGIITQNQKGNMFLTLHHLPNVRLNLFDPDPPRDGPKPAQTFEQLEDDVPNW